jgi:hypothetical protein
VVGERHELAVPLQVRGTKPLGGMEVPMKRDTMKRGDKGEKKLFGGYQCGGIGIPN